MPKTSRFRDRLVLLDEPAEDFLKTLACLGGYSTAEQARELGLANSLPRAHARLRVLEESGFLRKVSSYPVVYQVTKSVTRLLATDRRVRRCHSLDTVRTRLVAVNFYLEALGWPAELIFDHEQKIAAFRKRGYLPAALPERGGKPYLHEELVFQRRDGPLGVAIVDGESRSAFLQLWGFAKRFCSCLEQLGDRLELLIAVASEVRYRLFCQLVCHPSLQKLSQGRFEVSVSVYRVKRGVPMIRSLTWPDRTSTESINL